MKKIGWTKKRFSSLLHHDLSCSPPSLLLLALLSPTLHPLAGAASFITDACSNTADASSTPICRLCSLFPAINQNSSDFFPNNTGTSFLLTRFWISRSEFVKSEGRLWISMLDYLNMYALIKHRFMNMYALINIELWICILDYLKSEFFYVKKKPFSSLLHQDL